MEVIRGLFPLLFASINAFLILNILIFGKSNPKAKYVHFLAGSLLISQFSEFLICFADIQNEILVILNVFGVWLFPIFTIIFVAILTEFPKKLITIYYLLALVILVMLIANDGEFYNECYLLASGISYPSKWLIPYFFFGGLIAAGVKLNASLKSVSDEIEKKKRKILLYGILITLIVSLLLLVIFSNLLLMESVWGKAGVIINLAAAYYVIRDRYQIDGK